MYVTFDRINWSLVGMEELEVKVISVCVYGYEVGRRSFNMLNDGEVVVGCHNWASQGLFCDYAESACGGWNLFSVLGKMELIRIDDAMWKLVEMRVCVLKRMTVEIISTDDGGCGVISDNE